MDVAVSNYKVGQRVRLKRAIYEEDNKGTRLFTQFEKGAEAIVRWVHDSRYGRVDPQPVGISSPRATGRWICVALDDVELVKRK